MSNFQVQIFVEGIADKKFLEDYLKYLEISNCLVSVIGDKNNSGGKDKIVLSIPIFQENYIKGIKNVIIFDADEISKTIEDFANYDFIKSYEIDVFLFPNDKIDGDLET